MSTVSYDVAMPQTKAAKKALRASERKRAQNLRYLRAIKQFLKLSRQGKANKKIEPASFAKLVDKASRLNVIHPNKAARLKALIAKRLKAKL